LLAEYDRLPTLRQELERREQEKAAVLQKHATAIQKHAAVLGEIAKAQDGVSAAESAIGYAEYTVVEKLRALRRQAPSLFDVGGDVPRLVEPEQQEEP
jgi:chromatin segregation and condensation protein Rec8/ScpA/Scc1 (kleisin family)